VEEILEGIEVKVEVREIKKIGTGTERRRGEMLLVKLGNEETKNNGKEENLKKRKKKIWEDLT